MQEGVGGIRLTFRPILIEFSVVSPPKTAYLQCKQIQSNVSVAYFQRVMAQGDCCGFR